MAARIGVYYVSVGQGDCTVLFLPDEKEKRTKCFVIDCGSSKAPQAMSRTPFGASAVNLGAAAANIAHVFNDRPDAKTIDMLILTHPDKDHCNLVKSLPLPITTVVFSAFGAHKGTSPVDWFKYKYGSTTSFNPNFPEPSSFIEGWQEAGKGIDGTCGSLLWRFSVLFANVDASNENDASVVTQLLVSDKSTKKVLQSFLFLGDTSDPDLLLLAAQHAGRNTTVLKLSHHGARGSTTADLINALPCVRAYVASAGDDVSFGHPNVNVYNIIREIAGNRTATIPPASSHLPCSQWVVPNKTPIFTEDLYEAVVQRDPKQAMTETPATYYVMGEMGGGTGLRGGDEFFVCPVSNFLTTSLGTVVMVVTDDGQVRGFQAYFEPKPGSDGNPTTKPDNGTLYSQEFTFPIKM